jgi:integrase
MRKKGTVATKDLAAFVGHDDPRKVTRADVRQWIEKLQDRLSDKTIRDSYVASLKAVFAYGADRGLLVTNPLAGISLKVAKQKQTREKGYTHEEATRLLEASLAYVPAIDRRNEARENVKLSSAKQWVPLLCALTGARVAEVCQLRKSDLIVKGGVECIRINPEAGSVKNGMYRDVPLHEVIKERGFLSFVEASEDGPLFFYARDDRRGQTHPSKFVAGRISQWLQGTGLVPAGVSPSHGFRHAFKSFGMEAGIDVRILDEIQGHAPRTAGEGYGGASVATKAAAIAKFPRLV